MLGGFRKDPRTRAEAMALITGRDNLMTDFYSVLPHSERGAQRFKFHPPFNRLLLIKRGRVIAHRNCQIAALTASIVFLISYVTYHLHHGATRFTGQGIARPVYFTILTTQQFSPSSSYLS